MCLQETKSVSISDSRCFSLWGVSNIGWVYHEDEDGARSLLSMWHKDKFCYKSHVVGLGFISVVGQHIKSRRTCLVVNVYAACNYRAKVTLWKL